MRTLFDLEPWRLELPEISGLSYQPNYITPDEEADLVALIDREAWDTTWERRRQLYGKEYGRAGASERPLPAWGRRLAERMHVEGVVERPFDQLLVNEYFPGQGITLHCDYSPFDRTVVSLSLLSACVMDFQHAQDGRRESLLLERRSLLVLSDEARYDWMHGIARRKTDRWQGTILRRQRRLSVTLRLAKRGE